jgi:hypothetical protein
MLFLLCCFLVKSLLDILHGLLELSDALSQSLGELGNFFRPKEEQNDQENNQEFRRADVSEHGPSLQEKADDQNENNRYSEKEEKTHRKCSTSD